MVDSIQFVAIGDLHLNGLDNLFSNYTFEPNSMIYRSLRSVFKYARRNAIKDIIFLGDIFHSPYPTQAQQRELLSFFLKYPEFNKYLIAGNHDYASEEQLSLEMMDFTASISSKLDNVHFYTKPDLVTIRDVPFSMLPWPHAKTLEHGSVNIAHVETAGSVSDNGQQMRDGYVLSKESLYIIGHLHRRQMYKNYVYYPGTLYQRTFGEPLPKGFCHAKIERRRSGMRWHMDWIQVQPPYELINIKVSNREHFKQVTPADEYNIKQYKLFIQRGVELPMGFLQQYPNVIETPARLNQRELQSVDQEFKIDIEELTRQDTILDKNFDHLLKREGLNSNEIKQARKIVSNYIGS